MEQQGDGQHQGKMEGAPPGLPKDGPPVGLEVQGRVGLEREGVPARLGGEDAEGDGLVDEVPSGVGTQVQIVLPGLPPVVGVLPVRQELHAVS